MMRGPGFPDPLFEDLVGLAALAKQKGASVIEFLLFEAPVGPLRVADPILGDLTIMARESVSRVQARIDEMLKREGDREQHS